MGKFERRVRIAAGISDVIDTQAALGSGAQYQSAILNMQDATHLVTEMESDVDGTLVGEWFVDAAGTQQIRTFTAPYSAAAGLFWSSTPVLGPYLRYTYTNGSSAQSRFHLRLKNHTQPLGNQAGKISDFLPPNILAAITRSVLVGLDPSGTYRNMAVNQAGSALIADFLFEVAKGNISGHTIDIKFGRNIDIDPGSTPEDAWGGGGLYTGQPVHSASAETVNVSSSSANDTAAGTGARTVRIAGLDENWDAATEDLTLNGTSDVESTTLWHRVFRTEVLTAGSGGSNDGTISVEHSTTSANVFVQVPVGLNRSQVCAFTVPRNKTGYIVDVDVSLSRANGSAGSAEYSILKRIDGGVYQAIRNKTITTSVPDVRAIRGAYVLPEKTDILVRCHNVSDSNTFISADLEYVLIDNQS